MKKNKFTFQDFLNIFALVSLAIVIAAGLVAFNWWVAGQYGTGADFLPAWSGARAFLFERTEPYSLTVMQKTQVEIYGHAARANEFPYALDIPFPLLFLFFPFALIPDPVWARAAWMTISELGLLTISTLALRLTDWRPPRWFTLVLLAFALTWFFSVAALLDASLSILIVLALLGALVALRDFNDEVAGILLAVAAMKLEVTLLLWLFILWGVYSAKRWRVFAGLGMTWAILLAVSFLAYPTWVWPWLRAVAANWRADDVLTPGRFFAMWFPAYGARLVPVIIAILILILVLEWIGTSRSKDFRRVTWTAALSLALTPLIGLSTTFANLAPLVFSFIVILPFAWERWEKRPYLILLVFCAIFFALPLIIHWQLPGDSQLADGLIFLLLPTLTILGLYWVRWYVTRPPLTWLDGVKRELHK
jgi:hypothetical protein